MTVAGTILNYFRGREDYVAVGNDAAFAPQKLDGPLPASWLENRHLNGTRCLGFYLMREDNRVWCSCVDFDNKPDRPDPEWQAKAERLYYQLCSLHVPCCVEISASGQAAHVWLFFDEPCDAGVIRAFWKRVAEAAAVLIVEIYPRQDFLTGKGLGNLVRYPLWNQSRFVNVEEEGWTTLDPVECLTATRKVFESDLQHIATSLGWGKLEGEAARIEVATGSLPPRVQDLLNQTHGLLVSRWNGDVSGLKDESRSALVQSIACELVRLYVPTNEIEAALRCWCRNNGYEKGEREDWVQRTALRAYDYAIGRREAKSADVGTLEEAEYEYLERITSESIPCISSGIRSLDASVDGICPGDMVVIAARPGHGKSAFGLQWLDKASLAGVSSLIISEEMSRLELARRHMLMLSPLKDHDWKDQAEILRQQIQEYYANRAKILIVENCNTIDRVEEVIEQRRASHGIGVVAVDYLQLLTTRGATRYDVVTDISRRLKQAAKRNEVAIIALCQLNRAIESRDGHEPRMSDLRESGQIEQDADLVMFLQWPMKINFQSNEKDYYVYIAKRRNGPIREAKLQIHFDAERQRFLDGDEIPAMAGVEF